MVTNFDDLLAANQAFADQFDSSGFDGIAHAGVAIVTCMDSRILPLEMIGLKLGDAKILRNPGGRVDHATLEALVLAVHLLNVQRIIIAPHTRCAVASNSTETILGRVAESSGKSAAFMDFQAISDQSEALADDVQKVRTHPLIPESVLVGGFIYDVDTGLLTQKF